MIKLRAFPSHRLAYMVLAAVCAAGPTAAIADTFKIGIISILSGPAAESFGQPNINAAKLMMEKINKGEVPAPYGSKGIAGLPIELVVLDEAAGSARVLEGVRSFAERDKVDAILGPIASGNCLAVAPLAEQLQKFTILSDCGTQRVFEERSYKYVFRAGSHATMDNVSIAKYLIDSKVPIRTMSAINPDYAYGQDNWADFKGTLEQFAPQTKVQQVLWPKFGAGQYGAEISVLANEKSDFVYSSLWGGDVQAFLLQASPRGLTKDSKMVLMAAAHVLPMMGKRFPEGVIIGERGALGSLSRPSALNDWFTAAYEKTYNARPESASAYRIVQSILGLKLAAEKASAAKGGAKPSSEDLAAAMKNLEWDTPSGKIKMALGDGHQAIQDAAVGVTKWDAAKNRMTITDVRYYPAECINPPAGVKSVDWIKSGLKSAKNCG